MLAELGIGVLVGERLQTVCRLSTCGLDLGHAARAHERPLGRGLVFGVVTADDPTQPRTHLVWSIVSAALFFLPLGLIAVVFSWRTVVWTRRDDLARARRNSRLAVVFIIVTIAVGVLVYGGLLGALLALGAFSSPQ